MAQWHGRMYDTRRCTAPADPVTAQLCPSNALNGSAAWYCTLVCVAVSVRLLPPLQRAVGVVNVTLMQASDNISAVASCKPGTPFAMITNMAVTPAMRRRGIAHQLMQAAIRTSILQLDYSPAFALLLAYKYYEPAIRLYAQWGFEATSWEDPLWKRDAEKGRLGRQRRIMMVKQLSGTALAASPWQAEN
eukprot:GHRQ01010325.1.p1 GENE.GHRQ01010325.1~~GHRQ01010325.1.p1  ORF type:complete len:190 (+),score=44.36 GHRQ01010325.1:796-1365(+)